MTIERVGAFMQVLRHPRSSQRLFPLRAQPHHFNRERPSVPTLACDFRHSDSCVMVGGCLWCSCKAVRCFRDASRADHIPRANHHASSTYTFRFNCHVWVGAPDKPGPLGAGPAGAALHTAMHCDMYVTTATDKSSAFGSDASIANSHTSRLQPKTLAHDRVSHRRPGAFTPVAAQRSSGLVLFF